MCALVLFLLILPTNHTVTRNQEQLFFGHKVDTFYDFEFEFTVIQSNMHLEQLATNDLVRYAKLKCPEQESLELVKLLKKDESVQHVTEWLSTLDQKQRSF